ncbi:hypothetical protein [Thermocatellispora tengchongensis]|uniref:hypothetical protein n=1 Tax=Thermocatellispora tengchongensis TaxID=1073253 RepID=UPI003639BB6E
MPQRLLLDRLLAHVTAADHLAPLLAGLYERGTGAARQRALWSRAGADPAAYARLLAEATLAG